MHARRAERLHFFVPQRGVRSILRRSTFSERRAAHERGEDDDAEDGRVWAE